MKILFLLLSTVANSREEPSGTSNISMDKVYALAQTYDLPLSPYCCPYDSKCFGYDLYSSRSCKAGNGDFNNRQILQENSYKNSMAGQNEGLEEQLLSE